MKNASYQTNYMIHEHLEELSGQYVTLVKKALEAAEDACAPYSGYHVGAALLLQNGEIITGNNQENAAYPSGLCAECVVLFYAGSRYPRISARAIAITAMRDGSVQEEPGKLPLEVILYGSTLNTGKMSIFG